MGLFNIFKKNKVSKEELQKRKALFYELSKKHFDLGLLREIYSSDAMSICNLTNSMYLAFMFETVEEKSVCGVVVNKDGLKDIIKNNNIVYSVARSYIEDNQTKYIVPVNDKLIEVFTPIMEKRSTPGCESSNVDLELEKEIMRKYGKDKNV